MEQNTELEELRKKVATLEDENQQLQIMLQKVIKKYKKLKEKPPKTKEFPQTQSLPGPKSKEVSDTLIPQSNSELHMQVLQNIEIDNLSFIQSILNTLPVNFYFESTGNYLIHEAVKAGAIKVLHFLCKKGADMNAKSNTGESPLTLGAEENKHDAMCIILQQGREKVNIEFQNPAGNTALQIAVKNGNKEIVSLLLAHGANVNATNFLGDSLIKMAQRCGHQEIVLLLVNAGASLR